MSRDAALASLEPVTAAPRPLVILTLLTVIVASVSVSVLAWTAIATTHRLNDVVDKADRVADDASRSVNRLDRSTSELGPAIRSLRRAADQLRQTGTKIP